MVHVNFNLPGSYQARHPRERGLHPKKACVVTRVVDRVEIDITRIAFAVGMPPFCSFIFSCSSSHTFHSLRKAYTFFIILGLGFLVRPAFHTHSLGKSPLVSKRLDSPSLQSYIPAAFRQTRSLVLVVFFTRTFDLITVTHRKPCPPCPTVSPGHDKCDKIKWYTDIEIFCSLH